MIRSIALILLAAALAVAAPNAHANPLVFLADLDGLSESPPNASPGTGQARVEIDTDAETMRVIAAFQDLLGAVTAAHIHAPTAVPGTGTAGVATQVPTFEGFPLGVTSGSYDHLFDMTDPSTYNPSFLNGWGGGTPEGAGAALTAALQEGRAYFNIHSSLYPAGEIRGFLRPVPEPATVGLLAVGLAALLCAGYGTRSKS